MGEGQAQLVYNMFTNVRLTTLYHNMHVLSKGRHKKELFYYCGKEASHAHNPILFYPIHCK